MKIGVVLVPKLELGNERKDCTTNHTNAETETESIASLLEIQTLRPEKWPRSSAENRCPVTERQGGSGDMMKHLDRMQKNCLH